MAVGSGGERLLQNRLVVHSLVLVGLMCCFATDKVQIPMPPTFFVGVRKGFLREKVAGIGVDTDYRFRTNVALPVLCFQRDMPC